MKAKFRIDIEPPKATAQMAKFAARGGMVRKYDPPNVKAAKALLYAELSRIAPAEPYKGAHRLSIKWVNTYRKGEPKKNRVGLIPNDKRPDYDNLIKGFQDEMTRAGFFTDDSIIYDGGLKKFWSDVGYIEFAITDHAHEVAMKSRLINHVENNKRYGLREGEDDITDLLDELIERL